MRTLKILAVATLVLLALAVGGLWVLGQGVLGAHDSDRNTPTAKAPRPVEEVFRFLKEHGWEDEKLQRMRDELEQLGARIPGGFDPDRKKQSFFRATHGTVGTASCVVIDREGEMAYFMADPRDMDRQILRRVVERLLKE